MKQTLRFSYWLLLSIPFAGSSCGTTDIRNMITPSGTGTTFQPIAGAAKPIEPPVRLNQYAVVTRNTIYADFTYDAEGRQESVWVYNQRSGESKPDTRPMVMSYDQQGRLAGIGIAPGDPASGTVTVSGLQRQYAYTYEGRLTSVSLVGNQPSDAVLRCTYERDENGQILRQLLDLRDGYRTEYTYQYFGGNVVQMNQTITDPTGQVTSRQRNRYKHDTHPNPLVGLMVNGLAQVMQQYVSRNNMIKWTSESLSADGTVESSRVTDYTFQYNDKGYPTRFQAGTTLGTYTYNK